MFNQKKETRKKEKINYHLKPEQIKNVLWFLGWLSFITISILTIARISVIGQGIYDIFRLLFGWTQYLIFIGIFLLILYKKGFLKNKQTNKNKFQKQKIGKIIWSIINIYWMLGLVSAAILIGIQNIQWHEYTAYTLDQIIPAYYKEWVKSSVYSYKLENAKDFFEWHKNFAGNFDGGGVLGLILASASCYLQIIGGVILNLISWFFMYSYIKNNAVFYYLSSYEQRKKIKWENINKKKDYKIQTNTFDNIEDKDITIELDAARKINSQENENNNFKKENIRAKQEEIFHNKNKEKVEFTELEILPLKNENSKNEINTIAKDIKENVWNEERQTQVNVKKADQNMPQAEMFEENFIENKEKNKINKQNIEENIEKINNLFQQYQVKAKIKETNLGPRVTRYVVILEEGTKVQKILELEPELKLTLATQNVRLEAPIPGQSAVGIEVPNKYLTYVNWKEIAQKLNVDTQKNSLLLGIGKNLMNEVEIIKLEEMPHLLVAGSTGGGKTICLLTLISSLILQKNPKQLKLLLIDPKRVELGIFKDIPHLMSSVITDSNLAPIAIDKILNEIEKRYKLLEEKQVNNIIKYNEVVDEKDKLPFVVIVVDELADLILTHKQKIEKKIVRIGQIARAVGVFMILATQRPSSDIITSLIKTNIPGRIAFSVNNHNDSRTIINSSGAEKLLGKGDLLLKTPGQKTKRIQGVWINTNDIKKLTNFWKNQNITDFYWEEFKNLNNEHQRSNNWNMTDLSDNDKKLYEDIKMFLETIDEVSISSIQRKFNLGFNRAARLFEKLQNEEIISKKKENKSQKVFHDKIKFK